MTLFFKLSFVRDLIAILFYRVAALLWIFKFPVDKILS